MAVEIIGRLPPIKYDGTRSDFERYKVQARESTLPPQLLRRRLQEDDNGTLYVIEIWRHLGLTTKVVRRA